MVIDHPISLLLLTEPISLFWKLPPRPSVHALISAVGSGPKSN